MSEVLKKYLENNSERFSDELLYVVSTAYCKEAALGKTPKSDLYYALLNWRDTHDQVRKNCARLADTYEVCWYENGQPIKRYSTSSHANVIATRMLTPVCFMGKSYR